MKTRNFFILAWLCLLFSVRTTFGQDLNTRVTLTVKEASLAQVLQKMQHKYGFRFSYLNNEIPATTKFSAEIKDRPLSEVLDVLLDNTDLGYRQNKSQIIIKKGFPKNKPQTTTFQKLPPQTEPKTRPATRSAAPAETRQSAVKNPAPVTDAGQEEEPALVAAAVLPDSPRPSDEVAEDSVPVKHVVIKEPNFFEKLKARRKASEARAAASDSILKTTTHLGLIYPISTNGIYANKYVNQFSVHYLIGTAAGNEGAEFAGFGNIDQCYVNGVQFAGFFNVVQGKPTGNLAEDAIRKDRIVNGGQFAGFMNVADGQVNGGQFSGFMNVTQSAKGVQAAGFLNIAREVKGAQLAGFLNIANISRGVQASGFLNIAKTMSGVQLGIINIADSASGVPIGLLNLVDKGGYKRAEFYTSNDFNANVTYKIGVPKFHTMLALGAELNDRKRWGYGAGFGSEWSVNKLLKVNTDLVSYYVVENSYEDFPKRVHNAYELNQLNKFRLLGTIQIARHLALFGGPTYNVMVSQHQDSGTAEIGSTLAPSNTWYNQTSTGGTNVKMWVGFNAGLRF